jgi:hypothetical protein
MEKITEYPLPIEIHGTADLVIAIEVQTVKIEGDDYYDDDEYIIADELDKAYRIAALVALRETAGQTPPDAFLFLRKCAGLGKNQAMELLGATEDEIVNPKHVPAAWWALVKERLGGDAVDLTGARIVRRPAD